MLLNPGGGRRTELVEGLMHGFQHALEAMERADGCQDVSGIRPLGATSFDPASGFTGSEKGV